MVTDTLTDRLTHMPHNDPAQYTVLGWVKIDYTSNLVEYTRYKLQTFPAQIRLFPCYVFNLLMILYVIHQ